LIVVVAAAIAVIAAAEIILAAESIAFILSGDKTLSNERRYGAGPLGADKG
jgi:hypothetical protein